MSRLTRERVRGEETVACAYCTKHIEGSDVRSVKATKDRQGRLFCSDSCAALQETVDDAADALQGDYEADQGEAFA